MKLTQKLANLRKPSELTEAEIHDYLEKLYGDDEYHEKHEAYKNEKITHQESEIDAAAYQELARSHKDRAEQLISTLIQLSGHKNFSDLLRNFDNVTPGETRKTACNILELLEVITYKLANNLIGDINYFNSKAYTSTFNACAEGALTNVQTLLEATDRSLLYPSKLDCIKDFTLKFAKKNNIEYDERIEVHIVNTLLLFIKDQYNITVANDIYVNVLIPELDSFSGDLQTFVYNHFYSRKGAYALISCLSNICITNLEEYIDKEFEYNSNSSDITYLSNAAKEAHLDDISYILDYEHKQKGLKLQTICKLKQGFEEIITIAITQKLINDEIIDSNALIFTDPSDEAKKHIVVQTPIGWYGANYYYNSEKKTYDLDIEKAVKLIDIKDLDVLTSNGFTTTTEDYIARKLDKKQNLTFEAALESISCCPIKNPSIADRLFFISDFGKMLSIAFFNTGELSSLTSEDISLWKDILISKKNDDYLKICGEERFNKLIKTEFMDHHSAFQLMKTTGKSLLHIAVLIENPILVKLLLGNAYGPALLNPNIQDSDGDTAFHLALRYENQDIIDIFLDTIKENKIDTTIQNNDSKDAIRMAIDTRNIEVIQCIIGNISYVDTLDADQNNTFQYAINNFDKEIISILIARTNTNILHKNRYSQNLIHLLASKKKSEDLIQYFHKKGASLTDVDQHGYTPIHEAVIHNNLDVVKLLLSLYKEALTIYNLYGLNPVMRAAYDDLKDILAFFLEEKRKQNISIDMVELLDCAIKEDSEVDTIELICNDMDSTDINDELLYKSCKHKNADELISLFCEKGLNYNITNNRKNTPLHITAAYSLKGLEKLLSYSFGVNPNAQNMDGNTPFHIIALSGTFPLSNIDLYVENIDDTTPLDTMEPSETSSNTELDAENRYDNAPFDDTMEHSETSSNTDTYDENIDNNPPFDITKLPEIEFKSIIIELLDIFDHNIKNNEGLTPIDILKQRNAYNASLEEIITSYESRKRPILSTIEMPMVPEEGKSKRQRPSEESTCVLNDLNTSTVINNINELMNGINNTMPNQTNNPPDLGRGL